MSAYRSRSQRYWDQDHAVETHKPDLLILGARGLGTWKGIVLGSVSMAVTQRAMCPVLVVK